MKMYKDEEKQDKLTKCALKCPINLKALLPPADTGKMEASCAHKNLMFNMR